MKKFALLCVLLLALFVAAPNAQTTATTPITKAGFNELSLHVNIGWYITMEVPVPVTACCDGSGMVNILKNGHLVARDYANVHRLTESLVILEVYSNYFAYTTPEGFQKKFPVVIELHGWKVEITGWANPMM